MGIVVGELALAVLGSTPASLALATFVAMLIARAMGGARVLLAPSCCHAILVVAIADTELEVQRLLDALIGAGVALVFTQGQAGMNVPVRGARERIFYVIVLGAGSTGTNVADVHAQPFKPGDQRYVWDKGDAPTGRRRLRGLCSVARDDFSDLPAFGGGAANGGGRRRAEDGGALGAGLRCRCSPTLA